MNLVDANRHSRVSVSKQVRRASQSLVNKTLRKVSLQKATGAKSKALRTASRIQFRGGRVAVFSKPQV